MSGIKITIEGEGGSCVVRHVALVDEQTGPAWVVDIGDEEIVYAHPDRDATIAWAIKAVEDLE